MDANIATALKSRLRGFLLLTKAENVTPNVLAMLGLFPSDFPDKHVQLLWDEDSITVQSRAISALCDCQEHPKDPKVQTDGQTYHASTCAIAMRQKLLNHPCLMDLDGDEAEATWTFCWPRDLADYRAVIQTRFGELQGEALWKNFQKTWGSIVGGMPDPGPSLGERINPDAKPEPETRIPAEESARAAATADLPISFDDDLDFNEVLTPAPGQDQRPALLVEMSTDHNEISIVHGAGDPGLEAAAQAVLDAQDGKRGRGRPKGTTKAAKEQAKELKASDFQPVETPEGKKTFPACVRFAQVLEEELCRLRSVGDLIRNEDERFPAETIESLKNSLDRLALRTAHLQFRGSHDADAPNALNPMIEVTLANVIASTNAATRDLSLSPEKHGSWEAFKKAMKEVLDVAGSMNDIMSQTGMGPVISEGTMLKDAEGKTLTT